MVPIYYSADYVRSEFHFDTTRKAAWIAASLVEDPIRGVVIREPIPLEMGELLDCHKKTYVDAVLGGYPVRLADSNGFPWDPGIWTMTTASNGGAVDATLAAFNNGGVAGSLSSGLHHAKRDHGDGFCTFNGLALAAKRILDLGGDVLIVDLDAHCGGGTWDILKDEKRVSILDIAVSAYDVYTPDRKGVSLDLVTASTYLGTLENRLKKAPTTDMIIYNAGMDPFGGSSIGGSPGVDRYLLHDREEMVFAFAEERTTSISFVIAGGYVGNGLLPDDLVDLHRLTIKAAVNH